MRPPAAERVCAVTLLCLALAARASADCPAGDAGLRLPPGFCASVFADHLGHARHLAVSDAGVVYVNTWSGRYYPKDPPPPGGFLVALKDTHGTGHADQVERFGPTAESGATGGTGLAIHDGHLYAEDGDRLVRYALRPDSIVPSGPPQTVVTGLPLGGDHPMHPFVIDADGSLYVDVASATNACQKANRMLESPGERPCTELVTRAGLWRYDANRLDQPFSPKERYATGLRNAEGLALDPATHRLYATQHGRDQLHANWPTRFPLEAEATLPAEELVAVRAGADYGWPGCYCDPGRGALVEAPEYGGDGRRLGPCAAKAAPLAAYPAHWAPNGMAFYDRTQFPARYRQGLFIAFHGSWNRAPYAQAGYHVVFQALTDGRPGRCEIFASGFAGARPTPSRAAHRPSGVAVGPDGALYLSDDVAGRIYRVSYEGDPAAQTTDTVPCPSATAPAGEILAGSEAHATGAPRPVAELPVPPRATAAMVARGARVYAGREGGAACTGCHGADAAGSSLGPPLTGGEWLWSDGSFQGIAATIRTGVAAPRRYRQAMPAMGGARLTPDQVSAVAAYVWAIAQPPPEPAAGRSP